MEQDFYMAQRRLDAVVTAKRPEGADRLDGVDHREEISRQLRELGSSARRLADDLRDHPPGDPPILYDGYEGEWEELAHVPVAIAPTRRAARRAIPAAAREMVADEPGLVLHCEGRGFYMAPSIYVHGDEDWRWAPCGKGAARAVEFWRIEIAERRFSPRRWVSSLRGSFRQYRRWREKGVGRWNAAEPIRRTLTPETIRNWNWRRRVNSGEGTRVVRPAGRLRRFALLLAVEVEAISDEMERFTIAALGALADRLSPARRIPGLHCPVCGKVSVDQGGGVACEGRDRGRLHGSRPMELIWLRAYPGGPRERRRDEAS